MRFLKARFLNLGGIYNKSQIHEIEIDFTRCKHDMIYIIGKNGSGKSSLIDALHPLPDPASMYVAGLPGRKEIEYFDKGVQYMITIEYPVNSDGRRLQTKAFFKINNNGSWIELNPNGNIGTYRDTVYNNFALDANYMTLSKLSIEDRGIVDKTPSVRKKYVSDMLSYTEVYNDIYKTLSKRSSIFKSMINSITTKIDSIGDEEKLNMTLTSITNRIDQLNSFKDKLIDDCAVHKATIHLHDENGSLQSSYKELVKKHNLLEDSINQKKKILTSSTPTTDSLEHALEIYTTTVEKISKTQMNIDSLKNEREFTVDSLSENARLITIKSSKLSTMQSEINYAELKKMLAQYRKKIYDYEKIFKQIGYTDIFDISKDEYVLGLNTLKALRDSIQAVKSYATEASIITAVNALRAGTPIIPIINDCERAMNELKADIEQDKKQYSYYQGKLETTEILKKRPGNCNIDTCEFIKSALEALSLQPQENMDNLSTRIISDTDKLLEMNKQLEDLKLAQTVYLDLEHCLRAIYNNRQILNKLPNGNIFTDIESLYDRILNGDTFMDIYDLYQYIQYANIFELYKKDTKILKDLETKYAIMENKESIIEDLSKEIQDLQNKVNSLNDVLKEKDTSIMELSKTHIDLCDLKDKYSRIIDIFKAISSEESELSDIKSQMNKVTNKVSIISSAIEQVNIINSKIANIDKELEPLKIEKDKIRYSITQLIEYKAELAEYNDEYTKIEIIKKYSSPTKKGIQLIYMRLYMDKTLQMANQLLSYFFDGQLELLPYQITDTEFRIPCKNIRTHMVNDDISSCSTAERFMISMVLGFAMKYQSSTTYNIISLDEVDGTLDQENRAAFPIVIDKIRKMLNIEQCLTVSHASENDLSEVDVISLTPVSYETIKGNVIFQL